MKPVERSVQVEIGGVDFIATVSYLPGSAGTRMEPGDDAEITVSRVNLVDTGDVGTAPQIDFLGLFEEVDSIETLEEKIWEKIDGEDEGREGNDDDD